MQLKTTHFKKLCLLIISFSFWILSYEAKSAGRVNNDITNTQLLINYIKSTAFPGDISIVADKPNANIWVFEGRNLIGKSRFLYGFTKTDEFPGGNIAASYSSQLPITNKMVTPAGVFQITKTINDPDYGTSITFIQYKDYRLAIHRLYKDDPRERRLQRIMSNSLLDKNISFGCINVTDDFYDSILEQLRITPNSKLYVIPNNNRLFFKFFPFLQ